MSELVYGIHAVQAVLDNNLKQVLVVYTVNKSYSVRLNTLINRIKLCNINVQKCDRRWLDSKVKGALHQGIIAKISWSAYIKENDLPNFLKVRQTASLLLALDGITDPHNLGACLRSADAAGVHLVVAPKNRSVPLNSTVRKVASGSGDSVPFVQVTNLVRTLRLFQQHNIRVIGTVMQSDRFVFNSQLIESLVFVMGSEANGIRYLTQQVCDELVSIPMVGSVDSLNVSVATGICLFEAVRQRQYSNDK